MVKPDSHLSELVHNTKHPFRQVENRPEKPLKHRYERRKIREIMRINEWEDDTSPQWNNFPQTKAASNEAAFVWGKWILPASWNQRIRSTQCAWSCTSEDSSWKWSWPLDSNLPIRTASPSPKTSAKVSLNRSCLWNWSSGRRSMEAMHKKVPAANASA